MKNKSSNRRRRVKRQKPVQKQAQSENFFEANVQRKCEKCEDQEKQVQKKSDGKTSGGGNSFFGQYMNSINNKGNTISKQKRSFFEGKMNEDFGDVKLHRDTEAANAAKAIGAKAFAYKNHIVLNNAYSKEGSLEEKQLLAHELKHVQQQKNGRHLIQMMPEEEGQEQVQKDNTKGLEKEAEQEEEMVMGAESVPEIHLFGQPSKKTVFANTMNIQAETNASYDGGNGLTQGLERTPVEEGQGCSEGNCWHYTGQYVIDYSVTTTVNLPNVPNDLTPCQQDRVRSAIQDKLVPHEQEHVDAFNQYNGSVSLPINYTGPSEGFQDYLQDLHDTNELAKRMAVNATSSALDPFMVPIDLDCEDEPSSAPMDEAPE